jgi:hypothetical protein
VTPKLSLNYGLRWETVSPSYEKDDFFSLHAAMESDDRTSSDQFDFGERRLCRQ